MPKSVQAQQVTKDNLNNFIWIWQLQNEVNQYGSIEALISHLKSIGITNVCIKYHEGASYTGGGINFKNDYLKYYDAFKAARFAVGTWGYNYFNYPGTEANIIVEALQNSDYYIYDPEVDVSNKWTASANVCATVRRSTNKLIGYSTFPIATYHQDIPYSVFNQYCDFTSPQIYWGELQWSAPKAIERTKSDYASLGLTLPIYPSIQTYGVTTDSYSTFKNYGFKFFGAWDLDEADNAFYSGLNGSTTALTKVTTDALKESIANLQYDCNLVHGTSLLVDGIAGTKTLNTLNSYPIEINSNNVVNQWLQQKLIQWGYLGKGNGTGYWTQACFQAITELQKNWGRSTDGIIGKDTWTIFLTN
ncbi:peptidoglycan-binding domain-containing protein [Clostridium kluyveri]|uniref:Peptidoglycan binding-like domain-containing protein n=1 Tax=Clostridium kluyveri TaxID=1534 RepID=A0A1L5F8P2_CLOKL|nr:peptidoglycan-binding domain-containing protein [Clostridium kluyveri]APM39384.1 hypothetical protein BS101_11850 [Clostridium kluyveri]